MEQVTPYTFAPCFEKRWLIQDCLICRGPSPQSSSLKSTTIPSICLKMGQSFNNPSKAAGIGKGFGTLTSSVWKQEHQLPKINTFTLLSHCSCSLVTRVTDQAVNGYWTLCSVAVPERNQRHTQLDGQKGHCSQVGM